jgi:hypothetical protein
VVIPEFDPSFIENMIQQDIIDYFAGIGLYGIQSIEDIEKVDISRNCCGVPKQYGSQRGVCGKRPIAYRTQKTNASSDNPDIYICEDCFNQITRECQRIRKHRESMYQKP